MKFKREDIGLYFAFTLAGGGIGLMIGAFAASKLYPVDPLVVETLTWEAEHVDFVPSDQKKSRKKKSKKKADKKDDPAILEFIEAYSPTTIQISMLESGLISMEELAKLILKQRMAEEKAPYDYSGPYQDDKPELADLVTLPVEEEISDLEIIDSRYEILTDPPEGKDPKRVRVIYYDESDGDFYTMTRRGSPVPTALDGMVSDEVWEVIKPYMVSGYAPIFVDDLDTVKYYKFELIPLDEEDLAEHHDTS